MDVTFCLVILTFLVILTNAFPANSGFQRSNISPLVNNYTEVTSFQNSTPVGSQLNDGSIKNDKVMDSVKSNVDSKIQYKNPLELLQPAADTYYYVPFFRIRKITKTYRPRYTFTNYADSYDSFPTVA